MLALSLGLSCEGCPGDAPGFLPTNFGTLNPLFDRAAIVGLPGRVIDPRRHVPKRFRIDFILPVERSSIGADSIVAFVVPPSSGRVASFPEAPPYFGDLPGTPLARVRVTRLDPVLSSGRAVGLIASLDARDIEAVAGSELVIQVDPRAWNVAATTSDDVFRSPMRFTYRVSERAPDNDPPFVADVTGFATGPLDALLDAAAGPAGEDLVVAPHAALRFVFSEPLASAAPVLDPQDPVGLQLRPETFEGGGFTDLVTRATAGMVPGREHCISFVPPGMADIGPLSWGTQDLTGEPIVPALRTLGLRRAARRLKGAPDFCFRTGAVRIESPRRGALVAAANGLPPIRFIDASNCDDDACDGESWRISIRADDGNEEEVGGGWVELGTFRPGDSGVDIDETNGLRQGEVLQPVRSVEIVPLGLPVPGLCALFPDRCPVLIRVDRCIAGLCTLGDIIPALVDSAIPDAPDEVTIDDTDRGDLVIERVCVTLGDENETVELVVQNADGDDVLVTIDPDDPHQDESLEGGRVRRCATNVPVPAGASSVVVRRRDEAGNPGLPTTADLPCRLPPRKHVGYDGRVSAVAVDRSGTPHAVYVDDTSLYYARWDATADAWSYELVQTKCQGNAPNSCVGGFGWQVGLAINSNDEPVFCYTQAAYSPDTELEPGWERTRSASVRVVVRDRRTSVFRRITIGSGANVGCAIAARRSRPTGTLADYLVGYAEPTTQATALRYVRDDGTGLDGNPAGVPDGPVAADLAGAGLGPARLVDIAVDDHDAFWALMRCRAPAVPVDSAHCVVGERLRADLAHPLLDDGFTGRLVPIETGAELRHGLFRPRLAARGDGEVAVVLTGGFGRIRYAHRTVEPFGTMIPTYPIAPSADTLAGSYNVSDDDTDAIKGEAQTDNFLNNGGVASALGIGFQGIPADVAFSTTESRPLFAWAAARPHGSDYHAVILARPDSVPGRWDLEVIDGRVALSANVHLLTSAIGRVRIAYHNGLGNRGAANALGSPSGSLLFFREEDEDELFRLDSRNRRGDARCFAGALFNQDQPGHWGSRAGLDDAAAALVPRPSIDPDPCGRTVDPGFAEAVAEPILSLSGRLPPPPFELRQHRFFRLFDESGEEWVARTNAYRRQMLIRLRAVFGDLALLDFAPFGRADALSWNRIDPSTAATLPATDELFATETRGGTLDPLFLMFDELLDDFCGRPLNTPRRLCTGGSETASIVAEPTTEVCGSPGVFERNPNGFFRGRFYRDGVTATPSNGDRDVAAATSYLTTFSADPLSDDLATPFSPGGPTGLIAAALRGMRVTSNGPSRTADHLCVPIELEGCDGVDALELAAVTDSLTGRLLAAGDPLSGQSFGLCPARRPGAVLRGGISITRIGAGPYGCCTGYTPRGCATDDDCEELDVSFTHVSPFGESSAVTVPGRCTQGVDAAGEPFGVCERPPGCPDGNDLPGSDCPAAGCVGSGSPDGGSADAGAPDGGGAGGSCGYVPQCHAESCAECAAFYCDDSLPNPPAVPGLDPNADLETDSTVAGVSAALATARNGACDPGSYCEASDRTVPPCLLRQLFGHYLMRALPPATTDGLTRSISGVQDVASALTGNVIPDIFFDERIADTHVRWVEHRDGGLRLQGYLEVTLRLASPRIDIDAVNALLQLDIEIVQIEDAAFRFRLQPYFHAMRATAPCDSCRRRRADETIHWAVANAQLVVDHQPGIDPPSDATPVIHGCSLGCTDVTDCFLRHCDAQETTDGGSIDSLEPVGEIFDAQLARALSTESLGSLDRLFFSLTSDPLVGGIVFGRTEAVDDLLDAPVCQPVVLPPALPPPMPPPPIPPPQPAIPNPACTGGGVGHDVLRITDAIEQLRIRSGIADVNGRDNP